jgi:hypothetical protein
MESFEIFTRYQRTNWTFQDLPWGELDRARISADDIKFARAAVMGEATFIGGLHTFLNEGHDDYDLSCFASIWAYQELQHHFAFRTWLQRLDADVDQRPVEAMRPPFPVGRSLAQTLCTNIISELVICHVYHQMSLRVTDPVLRAIFVHASGDEGRHAQAFAHYTRCELARHPAELATVLETLYFYAGDRRRAVRHPSSVFKGELPPELAGHDTIDVGLEYFAGLDENKLDSLRRRVFQTFSTLTGCALDSPRAIRAALSEALRTREQLLTRAGDGDAASATATELAGVAAAGAKASS